MLSVLGSLHQSFRLNTTLFRNCLEGVDEPYYMALSFLLNHGAYHMGQMALIRKGLGLSSMRYD